MGNNYLLSCQTQLKKNNFNNSDGTMSTNKFNNIYTTIYGFSSFQKRFRTKQIYHKTHKILHMNISKLADEPQICFSIIILMNIAI